MFNLVLVGLNHRTAKLDFRQRASFDASQLPEGLRRLSACPGILESMIISTCNRVEILSNVDQASDGIAAIEAFLSEYSRISLPQLQPMLYRYTGNQAVRHLFRVASSLDSMILGEPQILGQVKSCYSTAVDTHTVGSHLNSLLQGAFRTAKRVRSETSIGEYSVSVSSAAVELVRKIFGDLQKKSILIVGAGKMGENTIRHLASLGAKAIYLTNRSPEAAKDLACRFHGIAVPFAELHQWISRSDVVITSTGASEMLIDHPTVQHIMHERKNAPIAFIDISVPRNVDPQVGTIDNVFCYDIDDLQAVVEANLHERISAAAAAEKIVDQEVQSFGAKLKSLDIAPVVVQIQDRIEEICRMELQRYLKKTAPQEPKQIQELELMASRIAGKIAHPLVMQLRSVQDPSQEVAYLDMIRRIFQSQNDAD
jgi:glutamyl-tRNA reductase